MSGSLTASRILSSNPVSSTCFLRIFLRVLLCNVMSMLLIDFVLYILLLV